jgi:hypothetical protein
VAQVQTAMFQTGKDGGNKMANNTIALLAKAPEFDTPMESQAKALQIRSLMRQGESQDMEMQAKRDSIQRAAGLRSTLAGFKPDAKSDEQVDALTRAGYLTEARSLAESSSKANKDKRDGEKAQREAEKFQLENMSKKLSLVGQILGGVKDQASWARARQQAIQTFGEDAASDMPEQYDPALVDQNRQQALSEEEQLAQLWKQKGYDLDVQKQGETVRHNKSQEGIAVRGQNMVDARARESRSDSLSKPFEVTGPDGVPVLVQQTKAGIAPVEGYKPKGVAKPLPPGVVKQLQEARDSAATMGRLDSSFKDDFGGKGIFGLGADAQMSVAGNVGADKDSVAWWKDYKKNAELVERHAMFGASLTPGEQASWRSADVAPGMDPAVIKTNLATRAALSKKVAAAVADDMVDAGHNETRVRSIAGRGEKPKAPTQVTNAADYAKVPSGTEYMAPDGQLRRKP